MIDLLLYVPHAEISEKYIDEAYSSLVRPGSISKELLTRYMLHEADRGAYEIALATQGVLSHLSPDLRVEVISVPVPRAFCDLNRPWERGVPSALRSEIYQERYLAQIESDRKAHMKAKSTIHIHTMCGRSPIMPWAFTEHTTEGDMERFLNTCYSGDDRHIDLLTHTDDGEQVADLEFAEKIGFIYRQAAHRVDQNRAYQLKSGYPATELMRSCSSVLIEYPKNLLATEETAHCIDTSQIVLDTAKIERMGRMLAEGIVK